MQRLFSRALRSSSRHPSVVNYISSPSSFVRRPSPLDRTWSSSLYPNLKYRKNSKTILFSPSPSVRTLTTSSLSPSSNPSPLSPSATLSSLSSIDIHTSVTTSSTNGNDCGSGSTSVYSRYQYALNNQGLKYDAIQEEAVHTLDAVYRRVTKYASQRYRQRTLLSLSSLSSSSTSSSSSSPVSSTVTSSSSSSPSIPFSPSSSPSPPPSSSSSLPGTPKYKLVLPPPPSDIQAIGNVPRGLYMYGTVGIGKTFLMDTLYDTVQSTLIHVTSSSSTSSSSSVSSSTPTTVSYRIPSRRVHFHSFMLEVHDRIHQWKQQQIQKEGRNRHIDLRPERDAIVQVAKAIATEAWLLCFDEFQVTDVADAMIVQRLFSTLFHDGVVIVATSNRPPTDLYNNGLNREYFLPFIDTLTTHCRVYNMNSSTDYRRLTGTNDSNALDASSKYFFPLNQRTSLILHQQLQQKIQAYSNPNSPPSSTNLVNLSILPYQKVPLLMGRTLSIRSLVPGIAITNFFELCSQPLGSSDYIGLCKHFHTLYLLDVPRMTRLRHNDARRFITLIDICYEYRINLILTAVTSIEKLFEPLIQAQQHEDKNNYGNESRINVPIPLPQDTAVVEANFADSANVVNTVGTWIVRSDPAGDSETVQILVHDTDENEERMMKDEQDTDNVPLSTSNIPPPVISIVTSAAEKASFSELTFAIQRAISRLIEITSNDYTTNIGTKQVKDRSVTNVNSKL